MHSAGAKLRQQGGVVGEIGLECETAVEAQGRIERQPARGKLGDQALQPGRRDEVEQARSHDEIDRPVERKFEIAGEIERLAARRHAGRGLDPGQQAEIVVDQPPALARNEMALERYTRETKRIYGVIERRLAVSDYIAADEYTVADVAFYPWLASYDELGIDTRDYPHVEAWLRTIGERPAVGRAQRKMTKA